METIVSPIGRGQGHELLNKLEAAGLNSKLAQRVIDSNENYLAAKVVRLIQDGGFEATASQRCARKIMGRNMFGIEEAITIFGVSIWRSQLALLADIPFSGATLEACKDTHVLVAVFPLSILEVRGKVAQGQRLFYNQDWYNKESFAKGRGITTSWHLVRKTPVEDSTSKTWLEQQALLAKNEGTPTAQVMVYTIIGHFLATGEWLVENIYVRSSDVDSDGYRVEVGHFDALGLVVSCGWGDDDSGVGVASALKFN